MDAAIIQARSVTRAPAEVGVLLARYVIMEERDNAATPRLMTTAHDTCIVGPTRSFTHRACVALFGSFGEISIFSFPFHDTRIADRQSERVRDVFAHKSSTG